MACIVLHFLEFIIQPPARYPDIFPVLNVLVSTPVFGLVWLWSIKSGIEVGWAVAGLGGGNSETTHTNTHPIHHDDPWSPLSPTDQPLSPLSSFGRRIGSPPAILGPHRPGVRQRTWSSASVSTNARTRGTLPIGPGWDRPPSLDLVERSEGGGETSIQGSGLSLNLGGRDNPSDRKRSRGQSLGVSNMRKRLLNFPGNAEGLPSPSD